MIQKISRYSEELADREAIRACIYMYCRAVDTKDAALAHQVYWPGAIDDHVDFRGSKEDFIPWAMQRLEQVDYIKHMICNIEIQIDGDIARSDAYYQAISGITDADGKKRNVISLGIYRDRFERRDDEWRIADRLIILTPARPGSNEVHLGWVASGFTPGD